MSHIFISYASEDRKRVQPLAQALAKKGWSVWWDRRIFPGKSYDEAIHEALKAAKSVVVVWTKTSVKSTWVKNESRSGLRRGILFPVMLADEVEIPLEFEHVQTAQLVDWQPDQDHPEFDQFIEALAGVIGPPPDGPLSDVKPVPPWPKYLSGGLGLLAIIGALFYFVFFTPTTIQPPGVIKTLPLQEQPKPPTVAQKKPKPPVKGESAPLSAAPSVGLSKESPQAASQEKPPSPCPEPPEKPVLPTTEGTSAATGEVTAGNNPAAGSGSTASPTKIITGKDCASMVLVSAGEFTMGSREEDESAKSDERPTHSVYLDAYYLDQYEVTTARYATFFQETKRAAPKYWSEQVLKHHGYKPVVGVDWNDAAVYCSWAGKRLPTEAEWEKGARGTDQRSYPWGNEASSEQRANISHCCDFRDYGVLTDVGSFKQGTSPYGAHDMAGNVLEWVADWYDPNYYSKGPERNPKGPSRGEYRVRRGGSWTSAPDDVRSADRYGDTPSARGDALGFRCAQDAPK
ncbi:MAG: SUMF1/EgtB/PvdO family nonheme iron enzyme [Nitrospira sp.]|nr:SUMF1/EgtB/PvdO family nonheme iron enzyme [Nitrospira sp.]